MLVGAIEYFDRIILDKSRHRKRTARKGTVTEAYFEVI
jgi:hypothetical protein